MWLDDCGVESEKISRHLIIFTNTIAVSCKSLSQSTIGRERIFFFSLSPSNYANYLFLICGNSNLLENTQDMWNIHISQHWKESHTFLCLHWLCSNSSNGIVVHFSLSKFKPSETNVRKCVKSQSEQADGAIFDGSVGIVLPHYCTTGSVGRHPPIHVAAVRPPLIKRTIPCWVIGSLGLLWATPSLQSCSPNLLLAACNTPSTSSVAQSWRGGVYSRCIDRTADSLEVNESARPHRGVGSTFQLSSPLAGAFSILAAEKSKLCDLVPLCCMSTCQSHLSTLCLQINRTLWRLSVPASPERGNPAR